MKFIFLLLLSFSVSAIAGSVSPYLPLKSAPEFEHLIEVLLAKAPNADLMSKPYKAVDIDRLNDSIKDIDPILHKKIKRYLARYKQGAGLTPVHKSTLYLTSVGKILATLFKPS